MYHEFEIGQEVTYMPYEKEFKVTITEVDTDRLKFNRDDDRVFYSFKLDCINMCSSGLCIKESKYFKPH